MRKAVSLLLLFISTVLGVQAQMPKAYSSADILHQAQKLGVFGRVLYIAAHPDDENTRLLTYLANERKLTTAYLSLTRGDGGQNLIGDEQGIALGLIRTQELLAARRIDGAKQFFTSAYDFGYSKTPEETLEKWGHDAILSDVVRVIRFFKPDVIITRFPTTGEGGHGHHTASAILAGEAFDAAADSTKFIEQIKQGLLPWRAKRLLWNTFNFGNNNTLREDQLKINVGQYNSLLGKSYGEIAAESRSQHKSQGFGVPNQRGDIIEYFKLIKGDTLNKDLMDGIDISINRYASFDNKTQVIAYSQLLDSIIKHFDFIYPYKMTDGFIRLGNIAAKLEPLKDKKADINSLSVIASGIFTEGVAVQQLNTVGDSTELVFTLNRRNDIPFTSAEIEIYGNKETVLLPEPNKNYTIRKKYLFKNRDAYQPYWLESNMIGGRFSIGQQNNILLPENEPLSFKVKYRSSVDEIVHRYPLVYKFTDPVKGEQIQPVIFVDEDFVNIKPSILLFNNKDKAKIRNIQLAVQHNSTRVSTVNGTVYNGKKVLKDFRLDSLLKGSTVTYDIKMNSDDFLPDSKSNITAGVDNTVYNKAQLSSLQKISYDHVPDIFYNYVDGLNVLKLDLKVIGKNAGYIPGAGDKVVESLEQMGYVVKLLHEDDINEENLRKLDVVVTGVRAYNVHAWLAEKNKVLMDYVKNGGKLVVQYNTNSNAGPLKEKIGPYSFNIGRVRVAEEDAKVEFIDNAEPLLNFPNKITSKDFEGWVQERSIYHAENVSQEYKKVFLMGDKGEKQNDGSLIYAKLGKGTFIYTGLVFFRQLPACVPGAYRLFANIIANAK